MFLSKSANRNAGADWNIQRHKIIRTNTSTHNEEVNFLAYIIGMGNNTSRRYNNAFPVAMGTTGLPFVLIRLSK